MASNEEDVKAAKKITDRIAFLASSMDAFFQDFTTKAKDNDALGATIAAARIAQLGTCIREEYSSIASLLARSDTDRKACSQACAQVLKMVNTNAEQLGLIKPEAAQEVAAGNRALN